MLRIVAVGLVALAALACPPDARAQGQLICYDAGGLNCQGVSTDNPLPVAGPVAAGAATSANQTTEIGLLQTLINQAITACNAAPVVSASAEAAHVLKATPGSLCGVYAVNFTSTAGFLAIVNTTAAPTTGSAITPLACVPLPANGNGVASINFGLGASSTYGTGITALLTSAANCFTYTSGTITGFIAGQVL